MKFHKPVPVEEIAQLINAQIIGNKTILCTGLNEIHKVTPGDITFSDLPKYFERSLQSDASIIILNEPVDCPPGKTILLVKEPFEAYNFLSKRFCPFIPNTAQISDTAIIGEGTIIEPGVVISHRVVIGKNCHLQANCYIGSDTVLGDRVNIHAGAVIGSDAFYYKKNNPGYTKWHSNGRVVMGNDVEIGANCTINKGVSGDTVIGDGTKFDSLIHIGHGAVIGKRCLFAAQVGIGGKTIIEDDVVIYGQVGIAQNIVIGAGATILAKSGVTKSIEGNGKTYFGIPAGEVREKYKELALIRQLPDILKSMQD